MADIRPLARRIVIPQSVSVVLSAVLQVRDTCLVQVRGFDVELYQLTTIRTRSKQSRPGVQLLDVGVWRIDRYVRWQAERRATDFFLLDEVDERLRSFYPERVGTVQRADPSGSVPSVRLSAVR